jgi:hypothetical protein
MKYIRLFMLTIWLPLASVQARPHSSSVASQVLHNTRRFSFGILHASKAKRTCAVVIRRHEEELTMLVVAVGLRELPDGTLRLIIASAAKN